MNRFIILGCGYIGTNLANYIKSKFIDEEIYVIGLKNEYTDYLDERVIFIEKYVEQISEDDKELFNNAIVIDAVGNINATNTLNTSSSLFIQNCSNKIDLINKLIKFQCRKYVFLSSGGTVYEDKNDIHKEDDAIVPKTVYALEKIVVENFLRIASIECEKFNYLILRLSNPYGGVISKAKKQGLIDVTIEKLINDECIQLYGDLENVRDYIYIDNLSEYIYRLSVLNIGKEIINVASGIGTSIRNVFEIIEEKMNKKIEIIKKDCLTVNLEKNVLDISKLNSYVTLEKLYTVEEGVTHILNGKSNIKK